MSIRGQSPLAIGAWFLASGLLVGAFAWPAWRLQHEKAETGRTADEALHRIAVEERVFLAEHHRYASFESQSADIRVSLPKLDMGGVGDGFDFDAIPDDKGSQHLRAVPKVEAVRGLRVFPNLSMLDLPMDPPDKP